MIVADLVGPWWSVERTDTETGETYLDERRVPQFLHDVSDSISWQDVTAQDAEEIIPDPAVCVWRVWTDVATLDLIAALESYVILAQGEVNEHFQEPVEWS